MKKSLVSALTTALVVGAASTTFAAANPFSDVPADHWAYDAIAQLAAEGVVDGYGDGSYRGEQEITRYEMAQMVARAMAKGASSAALDKLAAEFAQELNSLGVRVAALEKKVDNVKFSGEARYTAKRTLKKGEAPATVNTMELRLKMAAQVNKNWGVYGQYQYYEKNNGKTGKDVGLDHVEWMYAEGNYGKATIDLGQFYFTEPVTETMVFDDTATGIQVAYAPTKQVKITAVAGRVNEERFFGAGTNGDNGANLLGARVEYANKQVTAGVGYYSFKAKNGAIAKINDDSDNAKIWTVGAGYKFAKNFRIYGNYAQNTAGKGNKEKKAYTIQLDYKGMNVAKRGSYGIHLAYRHTGDHVVTQQTGYTTTPIGVKGWELSGEYALDKNIGLYLGYFHGKNITSDQKTKVLFSRIRFFF
ncbi:MAG: porin [Selenomonadaceae bacterium]|nr:porin [Selenomonadaceae bacterium]